jgi:LacI family transcriptional regulator
MSGRTSYNVSLREIAKETSLSITTVSRALRNQGEVSDETRNRILTVAKRMKYRPNLLVRGIQKGNTHTMGVMVPPYDSYWVKVLEGIHQELSDADYVYINAWCAHSGENGSYGFFFLKQLHRLTDRRVDGLILWAHIGPLYDENVIAELEAWDLPVVTIDHEMPFADSVETDEQLGAYFVAKHLLELGHRNIAHLAWDPSYKWAQLRRGYFEKEIEKAGIASCITISAGDDVEVPDIAKRLIASKPQPTAIYACSDRVAKIVSATVKEMGLRIPEDISIVGFADLDFAALLQPPLTTIRQDGFKMGKAAARLLVDRAEGKVEEKDPRRMRISCELIKRQSTGPAAKVL